MGHSSLETEYKFVRDDGDDDDDDDGTNKDDIDAGAEEDRPRHRSKNSAIAVLLIVIAWMIFNLALTFWNKFLFSYAGFNFPLFVSLTHIASSWLVCGTITGFCQRRGPHMAVLCCGARDGRVITTRRSAVHAVGYSGRARLFASTAIAPPSWFAHILVLSAASAAEMTLNNASLRFISVSSNQIVRAVFPVLILLYQGGKASIAKAGAAGRCCCSRESCSPGGAQTWTAFRERYSLGAILGIFILVVGVAITVVDTSEGGEEDENASQHATAVGLMLVGGSALAGTLWLLLSKFFFSASTAEVKALLADEHVAWTTLAPKPWNAVELLTVTGPPAFIFLLPFFVLLEADAFLAYTHENIGLVIIYSLIGCALAVVYRILHYALIHRTSALVATVCTNVKILVVVLLSVLLMPPPPEDGGADAKANAGLPNGFGVHHRHLDVLNIVGISVALMGVFLFNWAHYAHQHGRRCCAPRRGLLCCAGAGGFAVLYARLFSKRGGEGRNNFVFLTGMSEKRGARSVVSSNGHSTALEDAKRRFHDAFEDAPEGSDLDGPLGESSSDSGSISSSSSGGGLVVTV